MYAVFAVKEEMQRLVQEMEILRRGKAEVEHLQMSMSERAAELVRVNFNSIRRYVYSGIVELVWGYFDIVRDS